MTLVSRRKAMLTRSISLVAAVVVAALTPAVLHAQVAAPPRPATLQAVPRPTHDRVTLGGGFGGLSGAAHLAQASTADWRLGWIGSADATARLPPHVGLRARGRRAPGRGPGPTPPGRGQFNKVT